METRRYLTPEELRTVERWRSAILRGRPHMERLCAAGACLGYVELFRRERTPHLVPVMTAADGAQVSEILGRWNRIEEIFAGAELETLSVKINNGDVDVYGSPGAKTDGIGFIPLVVVGVIVIVAAITTTLAIDNAAKMKETDLRSKLLDYNAAMAREPEATRAAWKAFTESDPFKKEKSIWDRLSEGAGNALAILAVAAIAFFAFKHWPRRSSTSTTTAPISNPCGGAGTIRAPSRGGWSGRVRWSDDPTSRKRQAYHLDSYYYGSQADTGSAYEDEVPF